jgi:hypothetical protein
MSDIFPLFLHESERLVRNVRQVGKGNGTGRCSRKFLTYPAVPRVPKPGHGDIEADTEGEGSSKYGCYIDTCGAREVRKVDNRGAGGGGNSLFRLTSVL